jgi:hypothetical protein
VEFRLIGATHAQISIALAEKCEIESTAILEAVNVRVKPGQTYLLTKFQFQISKDLTANAPVLAAPIEHASDVRSPR